MRVLLIVDDEELALRATARLLKGKFDEILTASNSQRAEELLEEHSITHVLCDRYLAEASLGEQLIDRWRQRWPSIRFAALMTGEDVSQISVSSSVDEVFAKPFDIGRLRQALEA